MGSRAMGAALVALLLLSLTLSRVGCEEDPLKFYLDCFALYERFERLDHFSDLEREYLSDCGRSLGFIGDAYRAIGLLRPDYVEALRRWFDGNQTSIDREICFLDNGPRCANHTGIFMYHGFLQYDDDD